MKLKIEEVEKSEEVLVIATDGLCRKVGGKKRTGAGAVIKKGANIILRGSWGLGRRSNMYSGSKNCPSVWPFCNV